ncbi:MAG: hypothetical protein QOG68_1874 [Solirubrobacteraceae bacterium]|nr:hypothetical protein [Solirubrobacteraceae bacterium]
MPTFCRHGRLQANCPICSKNEVSDRPATRSARPARTRSANPRTPKASSGIRVRRVERAPEDDYDNEYVPGLRASLDGIRLADELAFAVARLDELAASPPGLYAQVASATDPEEAVWLAFLIAFVGPGRGGDAWSEIETARVPWSTGELPALAGLKGGPRTALGGARSGATIEAYRAWAARAGSQVAGLRGESAWEPGRRFARTFERLAVGGFARGPRYDFLVTLGALGVVPLEAGTLAVGKDALDPVISAAKRVFGIGDAINLERRASELARGAGVPFAALDLALFNFAAAEDERATMGARVGADPARRAAIGKALGVG